MSITYPPEMLPAPDEEEAQVIVCCGSDCCKVENERLRTLLIKAADSLAGSEYPADRCLADEIEKIGHSH